MTRTPPPLALPFIHDFSMRIRFDIHTTNLLLLLSLRAYSGRYLRMKEEGVYVCIICENPLFRSDQKYDSGCGWPSFHDVMAHGKVTVTKDTSHGKKRHCVSECVSQTSGIPQVVVEQSVHLVGM